MIFLKAHIHGIIGANLLDSQAMSSQEKSLFQQISARKAEKTDVPVAKANNNGYYAEMLDVMKGLM